MGVRLIGVVGPQDSVELVDRIATELGIEQELVKRTYADTGEAPTLARAIDDLCAVILFTGRVPYALAASAGQFHARLDFIPHEGADLYRALVQLLRDHPREGLPRISLDSMDAALVSEIVADVGVSASGVHVIPLNILDWRGHIPVEALVKEHADLHRRGKVDLCVTCMLSVYKRLRRMGLPVVRLTHSKVTVRDALTRSLLASRLHQAEASQPAACLLELRRSSGQLGRRFVSRDLASSIAARYAAYLGGALRSVSKGLWVIHSTRGAVGQWVTDQSNARWKSEGVELSQLFHLGIGFGSSVAIAEEAARTALSFSRRESEAYISEPDGSIFAVGTRAVAYRSRMTGPASMAVGERFGLSGHSLQRLRRSLKHLSTSSSFSAQELAHVSGISARTARRKLLSLAQRGVARQVGVAQGGGPGRPTALYAIDPTLLADEDSL